LENYVLDITGKKRDLSLTLRSLTCPIRHIKIQMAETAVLRINKNKNKLMEVSFNMIGRQTVGTVQEL
jgi:hypothetical protein